MPSWNFVPGRSRNVAYSAAKRALASFFESLRHAFADSGVVVQFYVLGYMDTELAAGIQSPTSTSRYQGNGTRHRT